MSPGQPPRRSLAGAGRTIRRLAIDVAPLRESRDFRALWLGELISILGRQITVVALPYQVFVLTHSSLEVGLIGLAQFVPLVVFSLVGGAIADRVDRRTLIIWTEAGMAAATGLLLIGAVHGNPPLWYLYTATGLQAGIGAVNFPARAAALPNLVRKDQLPAALALNQVLFQVASIVGPAVAGILVVRVGLPWTYAADVLSSIGGVAAGVLLRPLPPQRDPGRPRTSGFAEIREGFAYLKGRRVLQSTFYIDLVAMIFGLPRALFPVLALTVYGVGPAGLGFLYAAPAAGALIGALTTGWVGQVRRPGLAVIWAVVLWGISIVGFGLSGEMFGLALLFLAVAGAADVISAVFRGTILQLSVPDELRGRLSAVHIMVVTGGPRLGDVEAGLVASLVSPWFSVVSGGIACVLGALGIAWWVPGLARYRLDPPAPTTQ